MVAPRPITEGQRHIRALVGAQLLTRGILVERSGIGPISGRGRFVGRSGLREGLLRIPLITRCRRIFVKGPIIERRRSLVVPQLLT